MGRVSLMDELPENSNGGDHGVNAYVDSLLSTVQPDAMSSLDAEILNGVDNLAALSDVGIEERVDGFEWAVLDIHLLLVVSNTLKIPMLAHLLRCLQVTIQIEKLTKLGHSCRRLS